MKPNILLVEPNSLAQRAEQHILVQQGVAVDLAITAEKAIEKATHNNYDAILVDLDLQTEINGFELIYAMRLELKKEMPTAILSSYPISDTVYLRKAMDLRINWYIIRPMTAETANVFMNWIVKKHTQSFFITCNL